MFDVGAIVGRMVLDTSKWDKSYASVKVQTKAMSEKMKEYGDELSATSKKTDKLANKLGVLGAITLAPFVLSVKNAAKENGELQIRLDDLGRAFKSIQRELSAVTVPWIEKLNTAFSRTSLWLSKLSPEVKRMTGDMIIWGGLLLSVTGIVLKLGAAIGFISGKLVSFLGMLAGLAAANPLGAIVIAVVSIGAAAIAFKDHLAEIGKLLLKTFGQAVKGVLLDIAIFLNSMTLEFVKLISKIPLLPKAVKAGLDEAVKNYEIGLNVMKKEADESFSSIGKAWSDLIFNMNRGTEQQMTKMQQFIGGMKIGFENLKTDMRNWANFGTQIVNQTAQSMEGAFSNVVFDGLTNGFRNMGDVVRQFGFSVLRVLSDIIARAIMTKLVLASIGGSGGGGWLGHAISIGGALFGAAGSAASVAGSAGSSAGMFTGPAYSINSASVGLTGFAEGIEEVPSTGIYKLHQGEEVVPRYDAGKGGESIQIVIHNAITPEAVAVAMSRKEGRGVIVNTINADSLKNGVIRREVSRR